ncbi:MAG: ornithine carbamoyltransferase [Luteolibacter sp.]|jgi:ornithine carbamoyltransferase|nr:ornithine carbamoyltransferase [Luteolibacter sp.]
MKHLLSIEQLSAREIQGLLESAAHLKLQRGRDGRQLAGQTWALIFTKSSTRTRVSFEVGIRELGGFPMFLSKNDIQLGRGEPIKDTARVLGRMVQGAIIRTYAQQDVTEFSEYSGVPTINALTDDEHPCQILADLLTVREKLGGWEGRKIAFVGDGFSNMTRSWMWAAKRLGFELAIASPASCQPPAAFLANLDAPNVSITADPQSAVRDAHVINTDVWLSMGQEDQKDKEFEFAGFEVNAGLLASAAPGHIVLHCLPAYRGKEISDEILELHADTIFQEAENRLHAQKAILVAIAR